MAALPRDPGPFARPARHRATVLAGALLAALLALPAGAALYKWTDSNGRVVYSDQPPGGGIKYETVGEAPPPANPSAFRDMVNQDAEFKKRQADRAKDADKADKTRADAAKVQTFCNQARVQIRGLLALDTPMYRLNDKGDRVILDEAARKAEAVRLEQMMREQRCPSG